MNTYGLATIVKNEEITAGIWKMELAASEIAYTAEPGQFIRKWRLRRILTNFNQLVDFGV